MLKLLMVAGLMAAGMTGFELAKAFIVPQLSLWESHLITVLFSTLIATTAAFVIFRKHQVLLDRLRLDLEERQRAQQALQAAQGELEKRVQERTAELLRVNETLRGEIEDRVRAEAARQASEGRYRELVENANSIILRMTPAGEITFTLIAFAPVNML